MSPPKIEPAAAEALTAAGSTKLAAAPRRELENRIAVLGVDPEARNIGGILCAAQHTHGKDGRCRQVAGRWIEVFPDYATGAKRAIRLARLATGDLPKATAETAGFRSIAPEEGAPPLEVNHTAGSTDETNEERGELLSVLAGHLGGSEKAEAEIKAWRRASPAQRARIRAESRRQSTAAGWTGPDGTALLDALAGTSDEDASGFAINVKPAKPAKPATKRPAAALVIRTQLAAVTARAIARQRAADAEKARQRAADVQAMLATARAKEAADQAEADQVIDQAEAEANAADQAEAKPTAAELAAEIVKQLAEAEAEANAADQAEAAAKTAADQAEKQAGTVAGLFGPSDAQAHAFQDLAASWQALLNSPDAAKLPGFEATRKEWLDFAQAWRNGDNDAPACNGGGAPSADRSIFDAPACQGALNAHIMDMERLRRDLATKNPAWAAALPVPAQLTEEQKNPTATAAERGIVAPLLDKVPGLRSLTDPTGPIAKAQPWHYITAALVALGLLGGTIYGATKLVK